MNIEDAYISPLFNFEVDRMTKYTTKSVLCCAIADMSGKNIAVLQVGTAAATAAHSAHSTQRPDM